MKLTINLDIIPFAPMAGILEYDTEDHSEDSFTQRMENIAKIFPMLTPEDVQYMAEFIGMGLMDGFESHILTNDYELMPNGYGSESFYGTFEYQCDDELTAFVNAANPL